MPRAASSLRRPRALLALAGVAVLAALLPNLASAACKPTWSNTSPLRAGSHALFFDVAAVSQNDVWAVGSYQFNREYVERPLIQHWDGAAWSIVPSPVPATPPLTGMRYYARLTGIVALSATDVWAVGVANGQPLIEHWDGVSWSIYPTPPGGGLAEIAAVSATDIWAVGGATTMHWNGSSWHAVPSNTPPLTGLKDVVALAPNDVWAVGGGTFDFSRDPHTHVQHWDGTSWSTISAATAAGRFDAVASAGASSIWAVGSRTNRGDTTAPNPGGIVDYWNGTSSAALPVPGNVMHLEGVAATHPNDVWAVGPPQLLSTAPPSTIHWDGAGWTVVPTSVPTVSMTTSPSGEFWAVGSKPNTEPTAAVLCPMRVTDSGFSAKSGKAAQGATVAWSFPASNARAHSVYDATLGLFDSGLRAPMSSFLQRFTYAGQYTIRDSASTYKTTIVVPVVATPPNGSAATTYRITWASAPRPSGHVFDVQIKRPGSLVWTEWRVSETALSDTFTPDAIGTHTFRARLRDTATGRAAAWSQPAGISVRS